MDAKKEILDAIEVMVNQAIENNTTKIYTGICKILYTSKCVVTVNGKDNTVKYYGSTPVVGNSYRVFVPFGNMSMAFIIVPGINKDSVTGVVNVNGKSGSVILGAADVGALPVTTFIPTKVSQLENDSGYINENQAKKVAPVQSVNGRNGDVTITTESIGAIPKTNITQTLGTSTDKIPSEKAIVDALSVAGYGDMLKAIYDPTNAVADAGGIVNCLNTAGLRIVIDVNQPTDLKTGDFWYQVR